MEREGGREGEMEGGGEGSADSFPRGKTYREGKGGEIRHVVL